MAITYGAVIDLGVFVGRIDYEISCTFPYLVPADEAAFRYFRSISVAVPAPGSLSPDRRYRGCSEFS